MSLYDPLTYDNLMAGLVVYFERQPVLSWRASKTLKARESTRCFTRAVSMSTDRYREPLNLSTSKKPCRQGLGKALQSTKTHRRYGEGSENMLSR